MKIISPNDLTKMDILNIYNTYKNLSKNAFKYSEYLNEKIIYLYFKEPSTRTKEGFRLSVISCGGTCIDFSEINSRLASGAYIEDELEFLEKMGIDAIIARGVDELVLRNRNCSIVNAGCDKYHPSQSLIDLFTLFDMSRKKIVKETIRILVSSNTESNLRPLRSLIHFSNYFENFEFYFTDLKSLEFLKSDFRNSHNLNAINKNFDYDYFLYYPSYGDGLLRMNNVDIFEIYKNDRIQILQPFPRSEEDWTHKYDKSKFNAYNYSLSISKLVRISIMIQLFSYDRH